MYCLHACLLQFFLPLRYAGFSVKDIFDTFDRDASGSISVSEFCSLLRLIVGNTFDKRMIFRAINVLDVDGDKQVSFQELQLFIYRVWRSQIDDIVEQLRIAASEHQLYGSSSRQLTISGSKVAKLVKDRDAIKEALKRNYPR